MRRGPLVLLGLIALLPALLLWSLYRWADTRADAEGAPVVPEVIVEPPTPSPPLTNGLLAFRRLPSVISRSVNVEQFRAQVATVLGTPNDRSCLAVSVDGEPVGAANDQLAVIPASTQKLIVAATAFELLGADHTYTTRVLSVSQPVDGRIDGDLVLLGGGDPLLSSDWYPSSGLEKYSVLTPTSLDELADRVQAAGVTSISGGVLGDGSRYDDEFFAPGWGTGVAGLEAGPYDALMANDARVLGEDQRGSDPNAAAAREFTRLLRDRGITVSGEGASGTAQDPTDYHEVATIESAPLTDVIAEMLTNSDNNTAEMLVKEVAAAAGERGATRSSGLEAMSEQLSAWGIDASQLVLADGSGLSLDNRLTCAALLAVLQRFEADGAIGSALAVAGETGTLADVFGESPVAGRLIAKTGTLNNPPFNADPPAVKGLAGYLPIDGGGSVEFALVLNGPTISDQAEYRPIWDDLVEVLAEYPSGPSPAELGLL